MAAPPLATLYARLALLLVLLVISRTPLHADATRAEVLLKQGHVDEAAAVLNRILATDTHDAHAHELLCRAYYAQDMADAAVHECERAVEVDPSSSDAEMWLGRAYGMKASRVNLVSAFSLARKVHTAFERAVSL